MEQTYEEIINEVKLKSLFDIVRLVDPEKSIAYNGVKNKECNSNCYKFWGKDEKCCNCISLKAYEDNKVFFKIEHKDDEIYLVLAMPLIKNNKKYILEAVKKITDSLITSKVETDIKLMTQLVLSDDLTGCYNRRYINKKMPKDIKKAKKYNKNYSIVLIDIDYFKSINDNYGHVGGDTILKEFVHLVKDNIRKNFDWLARYGGEEFVVGFYDLSKEKARSLCERIRSSINKHDFVVNGKKLNITSSFGIAELNNDINDYLELISVADKNLYKSKNEGRDRIN